MMNRAVVSGQWIQDIGRAGAICLLFLCGPAIGAELPDGPLLPSDRNTGWAGFSFGLLSHDVGNLFGSVKREDGMDYNLEFQSSPVGYLRSSPMLLNAGATINSAGNTSFIYGGFLWDVALTNRFHVVTGLGLAYNDGETTLVSRDRKALGSHMLFRIPIELSYSIDRKRRVSLAYDHLSNAYIKKDNEGLDTFGIRFRYLY